jgi:hypothetical protein
MKKEVRETERTMRDHYDITGPKVVRGKWRRLPAIRPDDAFA